MDKRTISFFRVARVAPAAWLGLAFVVVASCSPAAPTASVSGGVPAFEVDPSWPKPLPNQWIMGVVTGLHVEVTGRVWVVQQTTALTPEEAGAAQDPPISVCCMPAPEVIQFDPDGYVVGSWQDAGEGGVLPASPHGIFVDHEGFVWIASNSVHRVLKLTRDGEIVLAIGDSATTRGSNDSRSLGGPAGVYRPAGSNEVFVADGYRNRRVAVFDAESGAYLRHWGAYGERPDDAQEATAGLGSPPSRQFSNVHGITGSNDGHIYVADRSNNRVQVFLRDGTYADERFVLPMTLASGSAFSLGLSADPEQTWLYLADGTNHMVHILRRADLEVVGSFGSGGRQLGQFIRVHALAVDPDGNVYTGEASTGRRVQRFRLVGGAP